MNFEEKTEMEEYAVLANSAYNYYNNPDTASNKVTEYLPNFIIDESLSDTFSTTLINEKTNTADIAYRGTQNVTDVLTDVFQVALGSPLEKLADINLGYFDLAQKKYNSVIEKYPNKKIETVGHSLGSSLSYVTGKKNNIPSFGFNSGSSPIDFITNKGFTNTPENIFTHYYVKSDLVGLSQSLIGSDKDKLIVLEPSGWLGDAAKTVGLTLAGGLIGGLFGAEAAFTASSALALNNVHSLINFMPTKLFKENLEPDDLLHHLIEPFHINLKEKLQLKTSISRNFDEKNSINKLEFFNNYLKICEKKNNKKCYIK